MLPRRLFANVAAALSSAADSFPLPMPPSGRRMGGLAACMAVHAFTQVRCVPPFRSDLLALGRGLSASGMLAITKSWVEVCRR